MNNNNKIWGILLKVALGLILALSFLQVKMKFGWDPIKEYLCNDSCGEKTPSIYIESIALLDSMEINVNETQQLLAQIEPANATNQNLKWSSSDTTVAIVDPTTGQVTATGKGGECCIITAMATDDSGKSDTIKIKVNRKTNDSVILVKTINFPNSNGEITLNQDSTFKIDAMALPGDATNKTLKWMSDNEDIATIDNGYIIGKREGICIITAVSTDGGNVHKSIKVRVQKPVTPIVKVTSISLDKSSVTVNVGSKTQVDATVRPSNATNKNLKWKSDKEGVATVNKGVITGKSLGDCLIIVSSTDGGNAPSRTIKVHVVNPPTPPTPPVSLRGNTIEEKVKYGLAYFSDSINDIDNKTIIANQMSKLFDDSAEVIVKRQNFNQINPNAKGYIVTISTSKLRVTYIGHKVNSKGLITELTVKQN